VRQQRIAIANRSFGRYPQVLDRLDPKALAEELGPISIPVEPLDTSVTAEQQAAD
jgi:hypothetical protein